MAEHASDSLRIGSRANNDSEPLSNIRKMLIFKGAAYDSASGEISSVLASRKYFNNPRCELSEPRKHLQSSLSGHARVLQDELR